MSEFGIVLVSHSSDIATGVYRLLREVAKDISITYAGGTDDNNIGTSFEKVLHAIEENRGNTLLTFFDLGSARMNLDMAKDFSTKDITIYNVPLIEGAYTASALLQAGAPIEAITEQLNALTIEK